MTTSDQPTHFHRPPQISFGTQITPRQAVHLRAWSASVPTIYFLDICMVDAAKRFRSKFPSHDRRTVRIRRLRRLDRPGNAFSYLLAMMEKVSDPRGQLSREALEDQVRHDVAGLRTFASQARVYEPDELVEQYLRDLYGNPIELQRPAYLAFLQAANDELDLGNPVAPDRRFARASKIFDKADALAIPRHHPVVVTVLARLYGNKAARKVLSFGKPGPTTFDAVNALADIMMIRRFAEHKVEIEHLGQQGQIPYRRVELVTDDHGVVGLVRCLEPTGLHHRTIDDTHEVRLSANVNVEELLTDLTVARRKAREAGEDDHAGAADEYERICAMLYEGPAR